MKVKFVNGVEVEYLDALETEEYFNGSNRRTLTFTCNKDAISLDALNGILAVEANLATLSLTNGETVNIYNNYVLSLECGIKKIVVSEETPEAAAVYADRLYFKVAKRTYIEAQLKALGIG